MNILLIGVILLMIGVVADILTFVFTGTILAYTGIGLIQALHKIEIALEKLLSNDSKIPEMGFYQYLQTHHISAFADKEILERHYKRYAIPNR